MIYFVRHGETYNNIKNLIGGNSELSPKGIEQAKATAELLKDIKFDAIYVSDYIRTRQTAEYINVYHNLPIQVDKRMNERFHGTYENTDVSKFNFNEIWDIDNEKIYENNIETISECIERAKSFLEDIKIKHKNQNILIVSHRGMSRIMQLVFNNISKDIDLYILGLINGEFYTYEI